MEISLLEVCVANLIGSANLSIIAARRQEPPVIACCLGVLWKKVHIQGNNTIILCQNLAHLNRSY